MTEQEQELLFRPIKSRRAFEQIAGQIKELIYTGVLKPGDKLPPERELGRHFGAGRMVVREALRVLEQAGFVYVKQGIEGGAFVKTADTTVLTNSFTDLMRLGNVSIHHVMEARIAIEDLMLEFVMRNMDDHDLDLLEKNIHDTDELVSRGIRLRRENLNFHLLLARATKNPVFEMITESIVNIVIRFLVQLQPDAQYKKGNLERHRAIYEALKNRDLDLARLKLREHLLAVKRKLSELVDAQGQSFRSTVIREGFSKTEKM